MGESADVIVVGVGTCGEDVALRLLAAGLEVIGIEPRLIGGECPFFACLPTKSMVRSANLLAEARRSDGLVGTVDVTADWGTIARRLREEVTGSWDDAGGVARFEGNGGRFVRGHGVLTGPRTVAVGNDEFEARRGIVVATGSAPMIPPIPGLADAPFWTTREAIQAEELPATLIIMGGGAVGCELGQVFARFGANVAIVEAADRLLPGGEPIASELVTAALASDGVAVHVGRRAIGVASTDGHVRVELDDGSVLTAERILVAVGRRVDVAGLGADAAGLDVTTGFVAVDGRLRATDGVWAVGDVTGKGLLTHVGLYQASIAVGDILDNNPPPADYRALPSVSFTDPEIAAVGITEEAARKSGIDVAVTTKHVQSTFRGWLHRTGNEGVIKLIVDRAAGTLVGATLVAPHAGEMLGMLLSAVHFQTPVEDLAGMIYPFPTFVGGIGEALGAYGRGITRVLDPGGEPMFMD